MMIKIAIIQHRPVYLNLQESIEKAASLINEAASAGASLVVFGETWFSGYPAWIDYFPDVALWNHPPAKAIYTRMYQNSLSITGPEFETLCSQARKHGIYLCFGANERIDRGPGNATIFNSLLIIGPEGKLLLHHRKLMPTYTEKLLYGLGDGAGLHTIDFKKAKLGGLICWEHWMPLSRQALHNEGEQIHIAVWPTVHDAHQLASRHYAFEGRCFVIAAGQILQLKDIPSELSRPEGMHQDQWLLRGGSSVIGPDGTYILEPVFEQEAILYAEIDPDQVIAERMTLDVSGHYQRWDIFDFQVNKTRK